MASKSAYRDSEPGAEIEDMLDVLDTALDRLRVMYEQYFLGIAKVAPSHLHTDAERKLREVAQVQIRNTALRYRFATLQQKYGSYNAYWRRTLRQIENGTYVRSLSKVKRKYENAGGEIPEEILAAMPKRMREQVAKDRVVAQATAARRGQIKDADLPGGANFTLPELHLPDDSDDVAEITSPVPREIVEDVMSRVDTAEMDNSDVQQMLADLAAPDVVRPATTGSMRRVEASTPARDDQTQPGIGAVRPPEPVQPPVVRPVIPPRQANTVARQSTVGGPPPPPQPPRIPEVPRDRPSRPSVQAATLPSPGSTARPSTPRVPAVPPVPAPAADAPPRPPPARAATSPGVRASQPRPQALPPGMTEADVRTLYQKYARARELVGEANDDSTYQALLRTLHQQAPKIMAQYKAKGVEFGVVIKDKQVVLKAKPKT